MANSDDPFEFDVALSFAGENRADAKKFADLLIAKHIRVFYDEQEAADLWGKDLIVHLAEIYGKKARYCVMFISQYYPLKKWTNLERQHAQARAFRDPGEYILPLRLDDSDVPGIAETVGYMDLRQHPMENIVNSLEQKLIKAKGLVVSSSKNTQDVKPINMQSNTLAFDSIPMPKQKKIFTQLDEDRFAKDAFNYIKQYFRQALQKLETHDSNLQTGFDEITNLKFVSKIYMQGNLKAQCRIWLGDDILSNTIYYNEGINILSDNAINDYLPVTNNGEELRLQIGKFGFGMVQVEEPLATQKQAAEYLWKRLISRIESR
jgi:hypothetical protein